ncbi:VC0807 family protein [Paenibacillus sp. FSL H7-0331]|uniref:VC0807 family protein n=1 Tax=Paenibacillus sp. FSL H7-0331 TaxID=1920421 RepID=UPI00096F9F8F|nr:VC0807 family protein [Paenibacillus sp. FSL H7-0331]OMF10737.1 hypothetical protein BK127_26390 [Paenibacillus sp. FSL H7-0331]
MNRKKIIRNILVSLLINGGLPLLVYTILEGHMTDVMALSIAAIIPLLDTFYHILKHKKLDVFAVFMATGFILSAGAVLLGGSQQLILLRESFVTGIMGLIFLVSLLFPKPIIYYFAFRFIASNDENQKQAFADNWKFAYARKVMRIMTAGWGAVLLGEAVIKVIMVYSLSVTAFLALSHLVMYVILGIAIGWTYLYRKQSGRRLAEIKRESAFPILK